MALGMHEYCVSIGVTILIDPMNVYIHRRLEWPSAEVTRNPRIEHLPLEFGLRTPLVKLQAREYESIGVEPKVRIGTGVFSNESSCRLQDILKRLLHA